MIPFESDERKLSWRSKTYVMSAFLAEELLQVFKLLVSIAGEMLGDELAGADVR